MLSIESASTGPELVPPDWVEALAGMPGGDFFTISRRIKRATSCSAFELVSQVKSAYADLLDAVNHSRGFHAVRFWNFIPGIHERFDSGQTRYMIFNAGRYQAFIQRFGNLREFDVQVPTASAVGHDGADLWIHCLASRSAGIQIGNPRQISPHLYSSRFGKLPPSFARATLLREASLLFIGGTASILGEDSLHNDLEKQTDETLSNLSALIEAAGCCGEINSQPLDCMSDVRIYHPRRRDQRWLEQYVKARLPRTTRIDMVQADLCRPELLVEIEAIAQFGCDGRIQLRGQDD